MIAKAILLAGFIVAAKAGLLVGGGLGGGLGAGLGGGLLGGLGGGLGSGLAIGGIGYGGYGGYGVGRQGIGLYAPPRYEYKYAVGDGHTGDIKEQVESRIGGLTRSEYATGENDRVTKVARLIAGGAPIASRGYY